MKKVLVVSAIAVVLSLLSVPLSAAAVSQASFEPVQISKVPDKTVMSSMVQKAGTNSTLLVKLWTKVYNYRVFRLLLCYLAYAKHPTKLMGIRIITMTEKVLDWVKIGLLFGIVDPIPIRVDITFVADPVAKTITAQAVNTSDVRWNHILFIGNGNYSYAVPSGYVTAGQQVTNCSGNFSMVYLFSGQTLFAYDFGNQTRA